MIELRAQDCYTGNLVPITFSVKYASGASKGAAIAVSSATMLVYDPTKDEDGLTLEDDTVSATADAAGTKTSFVSAALAGLGADFLKGMPVRVVRAGREPEDVHITAYTTATGALTLTPLPWAVAAGDSLTVLGYPLQAQAAAAVGGTGSNEVAGNVAAAALGSAGPRVALFHLVVSASWEESVRVLFDVARR